MLKQKQHMVFDPNNHVYKNISNNQYYTSVTNLISQFHPEFNAQQVAIDLITQNTKYKSRFAGYKTHDAVSILKAEWKESADKGSRVHDFLERYVLNKLTTEEQNNPRIKQLINAFNALNLVSDKSLEIMPEVLLFSDKYQIAGQADLILVNKHNQSFSVYDYKTNKKGINKKSLNSTKMFNPVSHLDDCNYNHYSLQLSLYAWMFEQETGYKCNNINILWIDVNSPITVNIYPIECSYLLTEIINILNYSI